ncbi:ribosomal protein S18 acetylase RimI-like enzyme [Murinocardiopsis flavida]|uniref:Ribosomal protein S18 acetylase RimI-like enzyme n=2 Tax=Murinocardiopsis flavida TaxID=645275 RepID=A0A2P8DSA1_9ACTN|nr:ribosomal protein S18 acetylase RimI-like enzyme [Murinocardiopsis flavida]
MGADGTVRVRRVRPGDGTGIARVRLAGWQHAYRGIVPAAYLDAMRPDPEHRERQVRAPAPGSAAYVAETAETAGGEPTIVGWLAAGPARDADAPEGAAEIYGCYVDPGRARLGVGRRLMAAALAETGPGVPVLLWVLKDNRAARRFYENAGFRADGAEQALDRGDPVLDAVREVRYLLPAGARQ